MIRFFDLLFTFFGLVILSPLLLLCSLLVVINSRGGVFYFQTRVGRNNRDFKLIKFRTMKVDADKQGGLTVGTHDSRITSIGYFLRKYKLDELPQLINVVKGEMSLVGPRPELRKYTDLYSAEEKIVLTVRPGITDWASIEYINENEILGKSSDPEKTYIEVVMPAKIALNKRYIENMVVPEYFNILMRTFTKLLRN